MTRKCLPIMGGCLCGAVRYESTQPPITGGYCHCNMCRKAYGSLFTAMIKFHRNHFRFIKGEADYHRSSDLARRGFCSDCKSPLVFAYDDQSTLFVLGGTLDYPGNWPFDTKGWWGHAFVEDKVSWYEIKDGLTQHKQTAGFLDEAKMKLEGKDVSS